MRAKWTFGKVLARVRREQGFASAHSFYRQVDGPRSLGLAYANYLHLEQGKSLPQPERLRRVLSALGLEKTAPRAQELVRSYLMNVLGSDDLLSFLSAPPPNGAVDLSHDVAKQTLARRTKRMTPAQFDLLVKNASAHYCMAVLCNTPGWVEIGELARMTGLRKPALQDALKALSRVEMVELAAGKVRTPLTEYYNVPPTHLPLPAVMFGNLRRYGLLRKRGKLVHFKGITVRMAQAQVERYGEHLSDEVLVAGMYAGNVKTEDTDVYLVEGTIHRVFD